MDWSGGILYHHSGRQSGSKSSDRGSDVEEKFRIFQGQISDDFPFSHQLKNFTFSPQNLNFNHLDLHSWLICVFFLKTNHFPTYFLGKIGYTIFRDRPRPPCDHQEPHDPQPKVWGFATPTSQGLTPMSRSKCYRLYKGSWTTNNNYGSTVIFIKGRRVMEFPI